MITVFYDRKNHQEVRSDQLMPIKLVQSVLAKRDSDPEMDFTKASVSVPQGAFERMEVIGELGYKSKACPAHVNWDMFLMMTDLVFLRLEDEKQMPGTLLNPEETRVKLEKHFGEPVLPLSRFCKAMTTWFKAIRERNGIDPLDDSGEPPWDGHGAAYAKTLGRMEIDIRKSNLLARLLHGGEPLRTEKCPVHKGTWSGGGGGCVHNCDGTGWLLTPEMVQERLKSYRSEYDMTDEQAVKEVERLVQKGKLPDSKDPGFDEETKAMREARKAAGKRYSNPILKARDMLLWMGLLGKIDMIPEGWR